MKDFATDKINLNLPENDFERKRFLEWSEQVKSGHNDLNYSLQANVDLTGVDWQPLGDSKNPYTGFFEGNGYCIHGLKVESGHLYSGLFGRFAGKVIHLIVRGKISGDCYVGGIAGYNYYGIIEKCSFYGDMEAKEYHVGGICGLNFSGKIIGSIFSGSVFTLGDNVGGISGYNDSGLIIACLSKIVRLQGRQYTSGIAGSNEGGLVQSCCSLFSTEQESVYFVDGIEYSMHAEIPEKIELSNLLRKLNLSIIHYNNSVNNIFKCLYSWYITPGDDISGITIINP